MTTERKIPTNMQQAILLQSKRRCAICFLDGMTEPQPGSIVRINRNFPHDVIDNLVFLCANHHAEFDQGKNLDAAQIKAARNVLYQSVASDESLSLPREAQDYEEKIADFLRAQLGEKFGDFYALQRNALYRGRSGVSHEVDLGVEFTVAGLKYLTVVEVKYRRNPLGIQDVLEFGARSDDIGANKAVLVCNGGFSPSAVRLAKKQGITLAKVDRSMGMAEVSEAWGLPAAENK